MAEASVPTDRLPVQCPLCLDTFSRPRSLPCLHTFCSDCLNAYITNSNIMATYSPFPCPVCRVHTRPQRPYVSRQEWMEQFPVNYMIVSLIDEMRVQKPSPKTQNCSKHENTEINMFCENHDLVCCPKCIALDHRTCEKVHDIEELIQTRHVTMEKEELIESVKHMENYATDIGAKCSLAQSKLDIESDRIKDRISAEKDRLIEQLDALELQTYDEVDEHTRVLKEKLDTEKEFSEVGKVLCAGAHASLQEDNKNAYSPVSEFVTVHKVRRKLNEHFSCTPRRPDTPENISFDFKLNEYLSETNIKSVASFGTITVKRTVENTDDTVAGFDNTPMVSNLVVEATSKITSANSPVSFTRNPRHVLEPRPLSSPPRFTVRSFENHNSAYLLQILTGLQFVYSLDTHGLKRQWVSGAAFLDHRLNVLCSQTSSRLCIFRDNKMIHDEVRQTPPWNVTKVSDSKIAVTYPQERVVRIFEVNCSSTVFKLFGKPSLLGRLLIEQRMISTNDACFGIAALRGNLVVACEDSLKVFSHNGRCLQILKESGEEEPKFRRAFGVAVDHFRLNVYTTDEANNSVVCFQSNYRRKYLNEEPSFVYKNAELRCPQGIAVNSTGEIYVCGFVSKNIHIISPAGEPLKAISMLQRPYGISIESKQAFVIVTFYPESDLDNNAPVLHMYKINPSVRLTTSIKQRTDAP